MSRKVHKNTGVIDGVLHPCPDMPNCVVTMYPADGKHSMKAWQYTTEKSAAKAALVKVLRSSSHVQIEEDKTHYTHATFTIPIFGFVDDVEFLFDANEKLIHFRSASRIGYSDLGANKRRMKKLFKKLGEEIKLTKV